MLDVSDRIKYFVSQNEILLVLTDRPALFMKTEKVQVGKDQEKAQSEKDSHPKNPGGKKPNQQPGTHTMKTHHKPNEQLFSQ